MQTRGSNVEKRRVIFVSVSFLSDDFIIDIIGVIPDPAAIRSSFFGFLPVKKKLPSGLDIRILSPVFFVLRNSENIPLSMCLTPISM